MNFIVRCAVYACNLLVVPTDAERAISLLRYASHTKVAVALQVSKTTVGKWAKGKVTPYRLRQLEQLLRPDLQIEETAPPEWAERLLAGTMALEEKSAVSDEELAVAQARAAIYLVAGTRKRPRPGGGGAGGASNA